MRERPVEIEVAGARLAGKVVEPRTGSPGVLFVHGWNGSQERDTQRARQLAQIGCICLTFDLRGHGATQEQLGSVSRPDNLADILSAFDLLAAQPSVDASSIGVVGSSYGGYLAALLTARRPVRWLALRVPALYRDADWNLPKGDLDRLDLRKYRSALVERTDNRALSECQSYGGDVLIVESERDEIVPHPAVASYLASFVSARSVTYRVIQGADHALSDEASRDAYDFLLVRWLREMIFGAR